MSFTIRAYRSDDEAGVVALWHEAGLTRPWNDPHLDIARKLAVQPELFLVGELAGAIVATAMGGYDGHRGSLYYFAVARAQRGRGYARGLMQELERRLLALGCPKLNLLVRSDNLSAVGFYRQLGYEAESVLSLGKRLRSDEPSD